MIVGDHCECDYRPSGRFSHYEWTNSVTCFFNVLCLGGVVHHESYSLMPISCQVLAVSWSTGQLTVVSFIWILDNEIVASSLEEITDICFYPNYRGSSLPLFLNSLRASIIYWYGKVVKYKLSRLEVTR